MSLSVSVLLYPSSANQWKLTSCQGGFILSCDLRLRFAASLTPVCAHFLLLRQESAPSDNLQQATCITLGVMLKFAATHDFCRKRKTQPYAAALYEVTFSPRDVRLNQRPNLATDRGAVQPVMGCVLQPDHPVGVLRATRGHGASLLRHVQHLRLRHARARR